MIIDLELDDFMNKVHSVRTRGFIYTRNKKNYVVTTHSFLPINRCITDDLKFCISSNWNELLILKSKDQTTKSNIKLANKLPNLGSIVSSPEIKAVVREICFFNFGFLPNYPKTIYIKLKVEKTNDIYPGTPFFDEQNRLVGISSFTEDSYVYILPAYYLEKTFVKNNKLEIPDVDNKIVKINKNIVKGDTIYNPYIGHTIPLSAYLVLESNRNLEFELEGKYEKIIHKNPNCIEYKDKTLIPNKRKILQKNNYYTLNCSLVHYLRLVIPEKVKGVMLDLENRKNVAGSKILVKDSDISLKV